MRRSDIERLRRLKDYAITRLQEASTWRGIVLLLSVAGAKWKPEQIEAFILAGVALAGVIAVLFPDKRKNDDAQ